jgi:transposase
VWAERIAAWQSSGLSAEKFCVGREFTVHSLRNWRRRQLEAERLRGRGSMKLARVEVVAAPAGGASPSRSGVAVEVGRLRVTVDRAFDQATFAAVLDVLARAGKVQA